MTFRRFLLELTTDANLKNLNIGAFNVMAMISVLAGGYMTWRIAMLGGYDFFEHEVPNEMEEEEEQPVVRKTKDRKRRGKKENPKKSRNTRGRRSPEMESTRDEVEEATYVPMEIREIMAV